MSKKGNYYSSPQVRKRMIEYLGGDSRKNLTCRYLTAGDIDNPRHRQPRPNAELPKFWEHELDISRSLWDRESLILHLDIEYVNFDFPALPYLEPARVFELQLPVERAVESLLQIHSITPLHLLSGRGHHFVWRVRQSSRAFRRLAKLGRVTPTLAKLNARAHRPDGRTISSELGAAFSGAGLVMEYLAHQIKQKAAPLSEIPVELTAVEVGPKSHGREMISLDISEYGDPLSTRVIRVPFSLYLKPLQQRSVLGEEIVKRLPPVFLIPLVEPDLQRSLRVMHDIDLVTELAGRTLTKIPDQTQATESLIRSYQESSLKQFHDWFYSQSPEPPEKWPATYDLVPLDSLPNCARHVLEHPNDLLLRPGNIERVVRVMLAIGWHPRHIAGLIQSKFERDYNWGDRWTGFDPATRADFYTRIFSGLFVTRRDDLVDFNCQSAQEEQLCFTRKCPDNLEHFKNSLLNRRQYERLASGPFNRLFLPEEHL